MAFGPTFSCVSTKSLHDYFQGKVVTFLSNEAISFMLDIKWRKRNFEFFQRYRNSSKCKLNCLKIIVFPYKFIGKRIN